MQLIFNFFHVVIYQPLYNALIILYDIIPDLGIAIILLTVVIRLILLPIAKKSIESQKKMQEIQPEIKKLQEKYKDDRQKQGQEVMALYKKYKINPASGCLPLIVQLVFLIALYKVFIAGISTNGEATLLYSFVTNPGKLNPIAFGFLDLSAKGNYVLAAIAAGLQFWQTKMLMTTKKAPSEPQKTEGEPDFSSIMQTQMLYIGPIVTFFIGAKFPAALPLYWLTTTLFMVLQQYYILNKEKKLDSNGKKS